MKIENAVILITGANRGLGLAFAQEALKRGARKVYAGARNPASVKLAGVQAIQLDVTSPEQLAAAAEVANDVTIVINNAGIADFGGFLPEGSAASVRRHMETNVIGPIQVAQAFAPVLAKNGGGAMLNVLSIASWINRPLLGVYGASKSAAWAVTNGLRHELREQKTLVTGLHMGFVDTDLTTGVDAPKLTPEEVVVQAFDAIEAGAEEVLGDDLTRGVKASLASATPAYLAA
jgi:NAD(P)-dependent dehydrogenase (short-subunit alcohol dehydrogenase family)